MTEAHRADPEQSAAELSKAARAVVRDPGDPRMDVHLAALGLGQEDAPVAGPRARGESVAAAELVELRDRISDLEGHLAASRARARMLVVALAAAIGVIVLLLGILVSPGSG